MNPSNAVMPRQDSSAASDDEYENVAYTFTRRPQRSHTQRDVPISLQDGVMEADFFNDYVAGASAMPLLQRSKRSLPAPPVDEEEDELSPIDHRPPRKHFLHLHVMQLFSLRKSDKISCMICSLTINGNAYACRRCRFYIHELCSGFPQHIHHAAHSAHSLELRVTKSVTTSDEDFACMACRNGTENPDGRGPDGQATPVFRVHYRCVPCGFSLHLTCAATSTSLIIGDDRANAVNLYTNFPLRSELGALTCDQCGLEIPKDTWVFFSRNTSKIFHFTCLADNAYGRLRYKDFISGVGNRLQEILSDDAWTKKSSDVLLRNGHREICHRHVLHRSSKITPAPVCQLCGSNIYDHDMYGCKACNYYFHENCSRIPQEIQHPGHMEHRLALVCFPEKKNPCRACGDACYWFSYGCSSCEFYINLNYGKCASYPQALGINVSSGDSKQFTLVYKFPYPKEAYAIKCDKCGANISKDVWMYYNRETDLKYHVKCAADKANLDLGWTAAIDRLTALEVD